MAPLKVKVKVAVKPPGGSAAALPALPEPTSVAKKRQALNGYALSYASASAIVELFRSGECSDFHVLLPPWDDSLVIPPPIDAVQQHSNAQPRPTKRTRRGAHSHLSAPGSAPPGQQQQQQHDALLCQAPQDVHGQADAKPAAQRQLPLQEQPQQPDSNSNEAATTHQTLYPPQSVSPAEVTAALEEMPQLGPIQQLSTRHQLEPEHAPVPTIPACPGGDRPHVMGTAVAVQAGAHSILPPSFLHLQGSNPTLAHSYRSLGPHDLLLHTPWAADPPSHHLSSTAVEQLINCARATKREGDALRGKGPWQPASISKFVQACLMFMEAGHAKQELDSGTPSKLQSAALYSQTAVLLQYTARACEGMQAREAVRDGLRILCERLAAVCLMRDAQLNQGALSQCAERVDTLLKQQLSKPAQPPQQPGMQGGIAAAAGPGRGPAQSHPQPAGQPGAVQGGGGAAAGKPAGARPSSADSKASSHDQVAAGGALPAVAAPAAQVHVSAELGAFQGRLLQSARGMAKYAELLRKSTIGFQALLESADVRASEPAKAACLHMAALCMDMGMAHPARVVRHARVALGSLLQAHA